MRKITFAVLVVLFSVLLIAGFPSHVSNGDQYVPSDLIVRNNLTVHGDLNIEGAVTVDTDLDVTGTLTFTKVNMEFIPIGWCLDGAAAPDAATTVTSGNGSITARDFGGAAGATVHDVVCAWEVPEAIKVASGVKFEVRAVVTDATGPSAEGLSFKISGYSVGDNDSIAGAFGTEVESKVTAYTAVQYDRVETVKSGVVTITNLAAGEVAFIHLERDTADADDTYAKPIGVTGFYVWFEESIGSLTF